MLNNFEPYVEPSQKSFKERFQNIANQKKTEQKEETGETIRRNIGQHLARTTETVIGLPGNFKKAALEARDFLESFLPEDAPKLGEMGKEKREEGALGLIFNPPTSTELREHVTKPIAKAIGGEENYLEPKNEWEKKAGEFNQTLTSMFLPGTKGMRTLTRIGAPIVGELGLEASKFLGADEKTAEKVKSGLMLMSTIAGQSRPGEFAAERINQAKNMIPQNFNVNISNFANSLMPLYRRMTRGLRVPSKSKAVQGMLDLAEQVQNNELPMHSLMDARDNINEWIAEAGGWDVPRAVRDSTLKNLNELKTQIIRTIDENLNNYFPKAAELYKTGYEAAAVNHRSNAISNFIEKHFGRKASSIGAKLLFPALTGGGLIFPKTVGVTALTYPLYKTGQVMYRVANSPTLAKYYQDVLTNSTIGNVPAFIKSMEKFDKAMLAEEKKEEKKKGRSVDDFKLYFKNKG